MKTLIALAALLFCLTQSTNAAEGQYQASFRNKKITVKEKKDGRFTTIFNVACVPVKESENGSSYACKDERGYKGNIATLNYKNGKGSILAKLIDGRGKSRTAFSCDVDRNKLSLKNCVLSGGRKVPGRPGLVSPFASEVEGVVLPNAAWLRLPEQDRGGVMRGMNPQLDNDFEQLARVGINKVVIFKEFSDSSPNALQQELDAFAKVGIKVSKDEEGNMTEDSDIQHVLFPYFGFSSYEAACGMVVDALAHIERETKQGNNVFFHCTVGEDRTGLLAGLYTLLNKPDSSPEEVFEQQMCEYGYEHGNAFKPAMVNNNIRKDLSPLYLFVSENIKTGALSVDRLSKDFCKKADAEIPAYEVNKCDTSTRLFVYPKNVL